MTTATLPPVRHDLETISLIGFAHGVSHFFHLLLPPLFPWLMPEFGLSFTAIGATMTMFFVVSAVGQALAGFLVDRFGPTRVLAAGMLCFLTAALLLSMAHSYAALMVVAAVAGLGNSVFHPADFTVLNHQVTPTRLGHAFSVHGLSGNLGWAAAPLLLTAVASGYGWRAAALAAATVAGLALLMLFWRRHTLAEPAEPVESPATLLPATPVSTFAFLNSLAVWLCFAFFLLLTMAVGAIHNFAAPILQQLYGLSVATAAFGLSAYMLGGGAGIVLGGFLAKQGDHDLLIAAALGVAALLVLLLATGQVPTWAVLPMMALIGGCTGISGPSRDLLVRRAATSRFGKAAYGRVYGFVYSGLDAGLASAPLIFGGMMDGHRYGAVLIGIAILQGVSILTAVRVGRSLPT